MESKIKILVVEDDPLIAEDIREILINSNYEVVAIAKQKEQALMKLKESPPDIVLLDINIDNTMDGIEIANQINDFYHIPNIYLTSYSSKAVVTDAKQTRPMGYIVKPFEKGDLYAAIEIAIIKHSQKIKPRYFNLVAINKKLPTHLTIKEFEILIDIYEGYSNKQIARKHFVSINTIKTHIQKIYSNLDTNSRVSTIARLRELLS